MPKTKKKKIAKKKVARSTGSGSATKKKPATRKKVTKRAVDSRSKKKVASKPKKMKTKPAKRIKKKKRAPAKKVLEKVAKKKTTKKTRKKAVKAVLEQAVARDISPPNPAHHIHHKQSSHIIKLCKDNSADHQPDHDHISFSFPAALSQVRHTVTNHQPAKEAIKIIPSKDSNKQQEEEQFVSPFVLDLKKGMTVNHPHWYHKGVVSYTKPSEQGVFSVFGDSNIPVSVAKPFRAIRQLLFGKKHINLAPIPNRFEPVATAGRTLNWLKWRLKRVLPELSNPIKVWQHRRLQEVMRLPSFGSGEESKLLSKKRLPVKLLSDTTVGGQPIAVRTIQALLKQRHKAIRCLTGKPEEAIEDQAKEPQSHAAPEKVFSISWKRTMVPFTAACLILILPFLAFSVLDYFKQAEKQVLGAADSAMYQLQEARLNAGQMDFVQASFKFEQAGQAFSAAGALLDNQYGTVTKFLSFIPVIKDKVNASEALLEAGSELSQAAASISQGVAVFTDPNHFLADQPNSYKLEYLLVHWGEARPFLYSAKRRLAAIDSSDLPEDVRGQVEILQSILPDMIQYVDQLDTLSEPLLAILGHDSMQRYLVLFQNNTELRPTGGFMGSIALVDIDRAEIKNIEIPGGGPYDYQSSLFENIQAPRALQLVSPRWELQDANWFFDWPLSAQKVGYFYEKAGGPSVDGVIGINTTALEAILELTGFVDLPEYDIRVTSENFKDMLQEFVEDKYDKELNQPKKIIADLAPILLERVKNLQPKEYISLAQKLSGLLQEREILIYHNDQEVLNALVDFGWAGSVVQTDSDYLAVVHTNLAGGKTDGIIKDSYDLTVSINEGGQITNALTIRREHTGERGLPFVGVRNVDYLRVFVPLGSELISATGFEQPPLGLFEKPDPNWRVDPDLAITEGEYVLHGSGTEVYNESGKTVFANWVQVDPGETVEIKLLYYPAQTLRVNSIDKDEASWTDWLTGDTIQAPQYLRDYRLYWQKQSGSWSPQINITVQYPQHWQVQSESSVQAFSTPGLWTAEAVMKGDSYWSWLFY